MADEEFDEMADACIKAGRLVMEHGTDELQDVIRLLLYRLGHEVVRRAELNSPKDGTAFPLDS